MFRMLLIALTILALPLQASEPVVIGRVTKIVDGDTLDVKIDTGEIGIRMHGIDTPERGQPYYGKAKAALTRLVLNKKVQLKPVGQSSYDRMVARVYLGDLDVNAAQLKAGLAYAETRYLKQVDDGVTYCAFEGAARSLKRGIWALPWEERIAPWEWRRKNNHDEFTDFGDEKGTDCIASLGGQRE